MAGTGNTPTTNPNLTVTDPSGRGKKGHLFDKLKGAWVNAQNAGNKIQNSDLLNKGKNAVARLQNSNTPATPPTDPGANVYGASSGNGMTTTKKLLIAGAGLLILGTIIYFATRKHKK